MGFMGRLCTDCGQRLFLPRVFEVEEAMELSFQGRDDVGAGPLDLALVPAPPDGRHHDLVHGSLVHVIIRGTKERAYGTDFCR